MFLNPYPMKAHCMYVCTTHMKITHFTQELSFDDVGVEIGGVFGCRQHGRPEAGAGDASDSVEVRRVGRQSGIPSWSRQHRPWIWGPSWPSTLRSSGCQKGWCFRLSVSFGFPTILVQLRF